MQKNHKWWSDHVLRIIWYDPTLQPFTKDVYVVKNTNSELTWPYILTFYYMNIFCKKVKYRIKTNFSKYKIRPPLVFFTVFLKKITMTRSSPELNGQG